MQQVKNIKKPKGQKMSNRLQTPKCHVNAIIQRNTFNPEERTVEVVWSTGAKGKRYTWTGSYYEELSMKKDHVRLERLNQGAPVLNNHRSYDLSSNLGVVEKAWIKEKQGHAVLRLSSREEISGIVKDIQDGIIRNISVGYVVHAFEEVTKKGDEVPTYRAVDWEPMEISFVNMPFDKDAQVRSLENNSERFDTIIINKREAEMPDETTETTESNKAPVETRETETETKTTSETDLNKSVEQNSEVTETKEERSLETETKTDTASVETKEVTVDIKEQEKNRGIEIRSAVEKAQLDSAFAEKLIKDDVSVEKARDMIIDELAERNKTTKTNNHSVEVKDVDQRKLRIEMASNALLHRAQGDKIKLHDDARSFRGMSLMRLAEEILTSQGQTVRGLAPNELAERALHSSSDFVEILANVANKSLRGAYEEAPQTFAPFTRRVQVADFKEISRTQLGDAPKFEKVNENGEYKTGKVSESAEKYFVETFGKIIGVTRKTLINDDMDAFSRLPEMFGRSARDLESELIYKIIAANPLMADGKNLFHADHGNLGTPAAIAIASVSEGRSKMRLQKGLNGALLNLTPKNLLVPTVLETLAEQFVGPIAPTENGKANPFTGKFGVIAEPRLDAFSATAWYLLASINQVDIFELATLIGQDGPTMTTKQGFEVDGVQFKVSYDLGAKAIDWRGIFKNAGV
jgi:hypothetical protein